jgi:phosphoribosyl 1,2-cyclic phosphodiesterase
LVEAHGPLRTRRVLIDCGFALQQLDRRLARAGLDASQIDALFITHEHSDHLGCAHALASRSGIAAVWMSEGTWRAGGQPDFGKALHFARDGVPIDLGEFALHPFTVPHDAREPLQLLCNDGARRLGVLTDLGGATAHVLDQIKQLDALLLEFNHDPQMLADSRYPPFLKRRISGSHGHLSNGAAAAIAAAANHAGLRHVVAAHLSERNNRPALVRAALAHALGARATEMLCADAAEGTSWLQV